MPSDLTNDGNLYQQVANELEDDGHGDYDGDAELQAGQASIHLATVEEKKRLWWRNAFITSGCIASWYTSLMSTASNFSPCPKVLLRNATFVIQQMDVFTGSFQFPISSVCNRCTCVDSVFLGGTGQVHLAAALSSSREAELNAVWVRSSGQLYFREPIYITYLGKRSSQLLWRRRVTSGSRIRH